MTAGGSAVGVLNLDNVALDDSIAKVNANNSNRAAKA